MEEEEEEEEENEEEEMDEEEDEGRGECEDFKTLKVTYLFGCVEQNGSGVVQSIGM